MAEASIAVYGAAVGVAIALAVVTFSLRGRGHHEPIEQIEWRWKIRNMTCLKGIWKGPNGSDCIILLWLSSPPRTDNANFI